MSDPFIRIAFLLFFHIGDCLKGVNMYKKIVFLFIALFLFVSSCQLQSYDHIPENKDVLISVNKKAGSLTFLQKDTLHKLSEWDLHRNVSGAVLIKNGREIVVYDNEDPYVDTYVLSKGKKLHSWKLGKGITNIITLHNDKLAVANEKKGTVQIVDFNGKVVSTIKIGKTPISMIEDTKRSLLYVSDFDRNQIVVINIENTNKTNAITVPLTTLGLFLINDGNRLLTGGHGNGANENDEVRIYSTQTMKQLSVLKVPLMPVNFFSNEDGVFAIAHGTNQIYKLDTTAQKQTQFIEVGSNPYAGIGDQHTAYATSYDLNKLYKINTQKMVVEKEISIGRGPFQLLLREGEKHE
jgi:DNA-binding beta-propeller fold protein YncE